MDMEEFQDYQNGFHVRHGNGKVHFYLLHLIVMSCYIFHIHTSDIPGGFS